VRIHIGIILAVLCLVPLGYGLEGCDSSSTSPTASSLPEVQEDPRGTAVIFASPATRSGSITENGDYSGDTATVGDSAANVASRGFLSFELGSVPDGAEVLSAVLDLSTYVPAETDPFRSPNPLGRFNIHCTEYGKLQSVSGFTGQSFCTLYSSTEGGSGLAAIDATAGVLEALSNNRDHLQLRMYFDSKTNGDGVADAAIFDIDAASITIRYR